MSSSNESRLRWSDVVYRSGVRIFSKAGSCSAISFRTVGEESFWSWLRVSVSRWEMLWVAATLSNAGKLYAMWWREMASHRVARWRKPVRIWEASG